MHNVSYCEWCGQEFIKVTNKVYCGPVCRTLATKHNAVLLNKRNAIARRNQGTRYCKRCSRQLSMYNRSNVCVTCEGMYDIIRKSDITKRIRNEGFGD